MINTAESSHHGHVVYFIGLFLFGILFGYGIGMQFERADFAESQPVETIAVKKNPTALKTSLATSGPEDQFIKDAIDAYLTERKYKIEITLTPHVNGNYARVNITPADINKLDPAWALLQKIDGKWTVLTLGTAFPGFTEAHPDFPTSLL